MNTLLEPHKYAGSVTIPSSKAEFHRLLFALSSASGSKIFYQGALCNDVRATISSLCSLGRNIECSEDCLNVLAPASFASLPSKDKVLCADVGESGTTYRFLLSHIGILGCDCHIKLHGRLPERPILDFTSVLEKHGMAFSLEGDVMIAGGRLKSGEYKVDGNVSSQYISSLLLALPFVDGDSKLTICKKIESAPYIRMTQDVLNKCGIELKRDGTCFHIKGNQKARAGSYRAYGDYSSATFFACIGALSEKGVYIKGLDTESTQGDKAIFDILTLFGAHVEKKNDGFFVCQKERKPFVVDAADIPDMVMALCALAATAKGESVIKNCQRLKFKESDRIEATLKMLSSFGVRAYFDNSDIHIEGQSDFKEATIDTFSDHRIAMASAVFSSVSKHKIIIKNSECINKSYPEFFDHLHLLQV